MKFDRRISRRSFLAAAGVSAAALALTACGGSSRGFPEDDMVFCFQIWQHDLQDMVFLLVQQPAKLKQFS